MEKCDSKGGEKKDLDLSEKEIVNAMATKEPRDKFVCYNENIKKLVQSIIGYYEKLLCTRDNLIECLEGKNSLLEKQLDFYKKTVSDYEISAREFIIFESLPADLPEIENSPKTLEEMLARLWAEEPSSVAVVDKVLKDTSKLEPQRSVVFNNNDVLEESRQEKLSRDDLALSGEIKGAFKRN